MAPGMGGSPASGRTLSGLVTSLEGGCQFRFCVMCRFFVGFGYLGCLGGG